jgi:hypothetical protein
MLRQVGLSAAWLVLLLLLLLRRPFENKEPSHPASFPPGLPSSHPSHERLLVEQARKG